MRIPTLTAVMGAAVAFALCCSQTLHGAVPKEVPLSSVKIDYDALSSEAVTYGIAMIARSDDRRASMTFKARMIKETKVTADKIIMHDVMNVMGRRFVATTECARRPTMDVSSIQLAMHRRGKTTEGSFTIKGGRGTFAMGDRTREMDFPAGVVTVDALFRIVPALPRTPSVAYVFDNYGKSVFELRPSTPVEGDNFRIVCVGPEELDVDEETVNCTRFELTGSNDALVFYVDDSGVIRQVESDDGQTIIRPLSKEFLAREAEVKARELVREKVTRKKSFKDLLAALKKAFPEATITEEELPDEEKDLIEGTAIMDVGDDSFDVHKYKTLAERRRWHSTHKDNPDHIQDGIFVIAPTSTVRNRETVEVSRGLAGLLPRVGVSTRIRLR